VRIGGILAIAVALRLVGAAAEIHVPADHPTIQAAVDAARNGDVIVISPGVYAELVTIRFRSGIVLRGAADGGVPVAEACWTAAAERAADSVLIGTVYVLASVRVTIEGITIIGPGPAVYVDGLPGCESMDVSIRSCNLIAYSGPAIVLGDHYRRLAVSCTNAHLRDGRSATIAASSGRDRRETFATCNRFTYDPPAIDLAERSGADVVVAVIDSGIDRTIPALACRLWRNPLEIPDNGVDDDENGYVDDLFGWDFRDDDNDSLAGSRLHWHGTFVAGQIADAVESRLPSDVLCAVSIMDLRILDGDGLFYTSDWGKLAAAIDYAVDNGARVINLSLYAAAPPPSTVRSAIVRAARLGVLVVAIAGNDAGSLSPIATWTDVFSVGAVDRAGILAPFSNTGEGLDAVSLGVDVLSLVPGGRLATGTGTSFAAPRVAGLAALQIAEDPGISLADVIAFIKSRAVDVGPPGYDPMTGWGVVE